MVEKIVVKVVQKNKYLKSTFKGALAFTEDIDEARRFSSTSDFLGSTEDWERTILFSLGTVVTETVLSV